MNRTALVLSITLVCIFFEPMVSRHPVQDRRVLLGGLPSESIRGSVWSDANGDGNRDANEPGLAGVVVYLDLNENGFLDRGEPAINSLSDDPSTGVDETGIFQFVTGPGTFVVREIVPDGFSQTFPTSNGGAHLIKVSAGTNVRGINFGLQKIEPASVHGVKWLDRNGNAQRDQNEPGLAGVTIYLDLNDNGFLDAAEPSAVSMTDNPNTQFDETGLYWLEAQPGAYTIREVVPNGFIQTFPANGFHSVVLASGVVVEGLDFGNHEVQPASVHGVKWLDRDGNGRRDQNEPGLAGVTIYLDLNDNGFLDAAEPSAVSMTDNPNTQFDESGLYWLEAQPGTYTIREVVPDGFAQTFPVNGFHSVVLASGVVVEGLNFGNHEVQPASVHGVKWLDRNGNGRRDQNEPGLAGVTIFLDFNDNGILDAGEPLTITMDDSPVTAFDETGLYWLNVQPGTHTVREVAPDGFRQTFPTPQAPTSGAHVVKLASGEIVEGINFGNQKDNSAFLRGDCNGDLFLDISDGIFHLNALFVAGSELPSCVEACNANDDASSDIADAVFIFNFLFLAGSEVPPAPHPNCGADPEPGASLGCERTTCQ